MLFSVLIASLWVAAPVLLLVDLAADVCLCGWAILCACAAVALGARQRDRAATRDAVELEHMAVGLMNRNRVD